MRGLRVAAARTAAGTAGDTLSLPGESGAKAEASWAGGPAGDGEAARARRFSVSSALPASPVVVGMGQPALFPVSASVGKGGSRLAGSPRHVRAARGSFPAPLGFGAAGGGWSPGGCGSGWKAFPGPFPPPNPPASPEPAPSRKAELISRVMLGTRVGCT